MPFFLRADQTFCFEAGEVVADRNGIDPNRFGQFDNGRSGLHDQGLKDTLAGTFHNFFRLLFDFVQ
jgi:hypothetical protein